MRVLCALSVMSIMFGAAQAADRDVYGLWFTPDRASIVEIKDCGDGTPCGIVRWIAQNPDALHADLRNRNADLRGRDMVGIELLGGFERRKTGWQAGHIYNPEDGRTYRARMELVGENELAVSGCRGPICKTYVWPRAKGDETREASMQVTFD